MRHRARAGRGMLRDPRRGARAALCALSLCAVALGTERAIATSPLVLDDGPLEAPFPFAPLAPPLVVNGGFCEYRRGHFHAGFDLGTDRRVGRPVLAPESGRVERVRASGVGYGRSLYLRTGDGRLLVFAHLDAFANSLDAYVREKQDSTGQYEQDLWPEAGRFSFRAGETLAWSGESGAGGPHLHFEIRRGDMTYHPQRAGLEVVDTRPPTLVSLTLEPLDDTTSIAGGSGPRTFQLDRPETLEVLGRVRAIVGARDGVWGGVDRMVPWQVGMEWNGARTECRFDSVSWATDMAEGDLVYDAGRVLDTKGMVLWSAAGVRPRVLRSDVPDSLEAGTLLVRSGDAPRTLRLWARDLGGGMTEKRVVLRPRKGGAPPAARPVSIEVGAVMWRDTALRFSSLPGGFVRMTVAAAPSLRAVDFQFGDETRRATRSAAGWSAVLPADSLTRAGAPIVRLGLREHRAAGPPRERGGWVRVRRAVPTDAFELGDQASMRLASFPAGALFEDAVLLAFPLPARASAELAPVGEAWRIEPALLPLRRATLVSMEYPEGVAADRLGLYRLDGDGWQWVGAEIDTGGHALSASSRQLGTFALFRDDRAPRATLSAPTLASARGPYSRWMLSATVEERGSGMDARASWFEVEGRRVPTEWDPEARQMRWRPQKPPAPGDHRVRVVTADRAGNVSHTEGTFHTGE